MQERAGRYPGDGGVVRAGEPYPFQGPKQITVFPAGVNSFLGGLSLQQVQGLEMGKKIGRQYIICLQSWTQMFLGVATQKVFMVFWHGGPTEQALNGVFAKADFK